MARDISSQGANNLWVLMYEKAYIKSGLKMFDPTKTMREYPELLKYKTPQTQLGIMKFSFMSIEGGDTEEALKDLAGGALNVSQEKRHLSVVSATKAKDDSNVNPIKNKDFNELINKPDTKKDTNKDRDEKNEAFYNVLKSSLDKEVEKRFTLEGSTFLGTQWHSVTRNVTREAVAGILMDFRNWSGGKEYMKVVNLLRKQNLSLKEAEVDDILKSFVDQMSKTSWYKELAHNCANLDEDAHYDDNANGVYNDLKARLNAGVVACGTHGYHSVHDPFGTQSAGKGLNGEYVNIGMAEKHAYVINDVWETDNGHKMITLTNPWGCSGLSYVKTKDASGKTTYSIKEQPMEKGGVFDLELNDFIRYVRYYT